MTGHQPVLTDTTRLYLNHPRTFEGLSAKQLATFRTYLEVTRFGGGETLFREGEAAECLYVIRRGRIEIRKEQAHISRTVTELHQGSIIGECSLLKSGVRSTTAVSLEPSECYALSRDKFLELTKDHPHLAMWIVGLLAERVQEADDARLRNLQQKHDDLRQAHDYLRMQLLDTAPYPIVIFDSNTRVVLVNPAAQRVFGECESGTPLCDYIRRASPCSGDAGGPVGVPPLTSSGEIALSDRHDREIFCHFNISQIRDENGRDNGLLILEDMTEKRLMEMQATQREHLAMKGEMAAEIAHSLNNNLTVLQGAVELLPRVSSEQYQRKTDTCLERMRESISQMQVFISSLLGVHHPLEETVQLDLNRYLHDQIMFLQPQKRFTGITFKIDFDEAIPPVELDVANLQQVFYNLVLNASEVFVDTENVNPIVWVTTRYDQERDAIELNVSDNGPGIDPEVAHRLFTDRVSTKSTGHGFGLLTVKRIVENWNGSISAANRQGGSGAEFRMRIPMRSLRVANTGHANPVLG